MIALASAEEAAHPLGIQYRVGDGRKLDFSESFDLAAAAYLLNYARNREELEAMCHGIAHCLKPGGRFVTANSNPAMNFTRNDSFRKYGFEVNVEGEVREGTSYTWTFLLDDGPLCVENYHLDKATVEQALRSAGFREVHWHAPRVSPLGEAAEGRDYWTSFLTEAPVIFLECLK
jgi:ubiquinone/menaquinone biosynthesis C-methylase UbiE